MPLRGGVVVTPGCARVGPGPLQCRIDTNVPQATEIEHQTVVGRRECGPAVAAAADGQRHLMFPRSTNGRLNIGHVTRGERRGREPMRTYVQIQGRVVQDVERCANWSRRSTAQALHPCRHLASSSLGEVYISKLQPNVYQLIVMLQGGAPHSSVVCRLHGCTAGPEPDRGDP